MRTALLESLYQKYNIYNFEFGAIHDKLGDVYEEYCVTLLKDSCLLKKMLTNKADTLDERVFTDILRCNGVTNLNSIKSISATNSVPHRASGGLPKTDIIITIDYKDGSVKKYPMSCKQSTVSKVALAEFDVDTICNEMGITNPRLKQLMLKHQVDKSAKNFTAAEKQELNDLMRPIAKDFVRWVLTGSPDKNDNDIRIPKSIITFKLTKPADRYAINVEKGDFDYFDYSTHTIEEYIDIIMLNKSGKPKPGGFGTGLSWTYATGSGGYKIQFKGTI